MILGLLKIGEHQAASGGLWAFMIYSGLGRMASSGYHLEGTEVFTMKFMFTTKHQSKLIVFVEIFSDSLMTF